MTYISKLVAGTKFPAPVGLTDDQVAKGVAFADANLLQGGQHSYDTLAERNAIPAQRRKSGMMVSVWEGATGNRPVSYALRAGLLPATPAGFAPASYSLRVPMMEEVYEISYEVAHPNHSGTTTGAETVTTPTGNYYIYLSDLLPEHPSVAMDGSVMVRVYPSGTAGWFLFYADEPIEAKDENTWMVYEEFYDGDNYLGYSGTFNNVWNTGSQYYSAAHLTAAPGAPATAEQPSLMGLTEDQSDVWVELSVEAPVVSVSSFSEMIQMRDAQLFVPHLYYLFPYRCRYRRPGTNELVTSTHTETILAQASGPGMLASSVKSVEFPQDTILFKLADNYNGVQELEGQITFRRDELQGLEAGYDWRAVQFARDRVTGLDYDPATTVAGGYEATPRFTLIANNLPQSYREHQLRFMTLNHPANPTITLKRAAGGQHTTELKKVDGTSLAQNELATLLADGLGRAIVSFCVALNCYTVISAQPEEAVLAGKYLGVVGSTTAYRATRFVRDAAQRQLFYTFGNREGSGCMDCVIVGQRGVDNLPDIVLAGASLNDVRIGVACKQITLMSLHQVRNVRIGADCFDVHAFGSIKGLHLGAGSNEVLVGGDEFKDIELLPRGASATMVYDSVFLLSRITSNNTRTLEVKYGDIASVQVRHRANNIARITLGYAQDLYLNISDGWDQVVLEYAYRKSWEFGAVWNYVTYLGSRPTTAEDLASVRESLASTVVIDSYVLQFPKAVANGAAMTPMVMDAQGNIFKWNGTIDEAATAGSIAKRDATGGLFATEFTMTSDARLKTDLEHITPDEALELVRQLHSYYYRRNDIKNAPLEIGFLAQEVQGIAPALTKCLPHHFLSDALGVNYARAVALLAPAMQALLGRIEQLEKGQ